MLTGFIQEPDGTWTPRLFFGLSPGVGMEQLYSHAAKVVDALARGGIECVLIGW